MKIHLIKKQTIDEYAASNVQSIAAFASWFEIIKWVEWNNPNDIIATFNSADILGKSPFFLKWIGTHSEYTKLCNARKQYTVNI